MKRNHNFIKLSLVFFLFLNIYYTAFAQTEPEKESGKLRIEEGFFGLVIIQDDNRLSSTEIRSLYKSNPEALRLYDGGKGLNALSFVLAFAGGALLGYNITRPAGDQSRSFGLVGGIVGVAGGLALNIGGNSKIRRSVEEYNNGLLTALKITIQPFTTGLQAGICVKF